jgi:hypothetical protein
MMELPEIVEHLARAFKAVDVAAPRGRSKKGEYSPGIGPLAENDAVCRALGWLKEVEPGLYENAGPRAYPGSRQTCDLVIPSYWAIECKLIRPFGNNGVEAEHWSENILHPYRGNVSAVGDAIKLVESGFRERKAIAVFGYEHVPAGIELDRAVRCFELICRDVLEIRLGQRYSSTFSDLIHPCHQCGKIFAWEVSSKV